MSAAMDLREALKAVRFEKGSTQATLAHRLGIRSEIVCRWERGKSRPRPPDLRALRVWPRDPSRFASLVNATEPEREPLEFERYQRASPLTIFEWVMNR